MWREVRPTKLEVFTFQSIMRGWKRVPMGQGLDMSTPNVRFVTTEIRYAERMPCCLSPHPQQVTLLLHR